jgi:hypothetical protein
MAKEPTEQNPPIVDEPGHAERFERTLRNLLNTRPKPRKSTRVANSSKKPRN